MLSLLRLLRSLFPIGKKVKKVRTISQLVRSVHTIPEFTCHLFGQIFSLTPHKFSEPFNYIYCYFDTTKYSQSKSPKESVPA